MKKTIIVIASVLALSSCTTTQQGATIGGVTGAAIGAAATGTAGGAVVGGLIGGTAGALIGRAAAPNTCIYRNQWGYRYYAPCPR
ncbi:MAG: glycine zipper domain-containing protein [Pseudomonadota bacterium]